MEYKKQAFYNTVGNLVYLGCQWLILVIIVRVNGYKDAGVFSLAMSIANVFYCIAYYGIRPFQVSDSLGKFSPYEFVITKYITIAMSILVSGFYLLVAKYDVQQTYAIIFYLVYRLFETMSDVYFGEMQKIGKLEYAGFSMSIKGVLSLIGFSSLLWMTNSLNLSLFLICCIAMLFTVFYDYRISRKWINYENGIDITKVKTLLWECLPVMLSNLIPIIITAIPRVYLEAWYGKSYLGYFSSISLPSVIIIVLVPNVLLPFMTLYGICFSKSEYRKLYSMFYISMLATIGLGLISWIFAVFLGDFALSLVFGKAISEYSHLFKYVIVYTTLSALTMCGNAILIVMRKSKALISFSVLALIACLISGQILIKSYGMLGAIWTSGITFTVQIIAQILYLHIVFRKLILWKKSLSNETILP